MRTQPLTHGTLEPVTVAEAKAFARVQSGDIEDAKFAAMITAARRACEEYARFSIVQRQWTTVYRAPKFNSFGMGLGGSWIDPDNIVEYASVPRRPVVSIDSLEWRFYDYEPLVLTTTRDYTYDPDDNKLFWKAGRLEVPKGVANLVVTYTAGFAPEEAQEPTRTDAPDEIRMAVLQTVQHYYENREQATMNKIPAIARQHLHGWWQSASVS